MGKCVYARSTALQRESLFLRHFPTLKCSVFGFITRNRPVAVPDEGKANFLYRPHSAIFPHMKIPVPTRPDFLTMIFVQYDGGRSLVLVAWWYAPYVGLFTVTLRPWCSSLCSSNYPLKNRHKWANEKRPRFLGLNVSCACCVCQLLFPFVALFRHVILFLFVVLFQRVGLFDIGFLGGNKRK